MPTLAPGNFSVHIFVVFFMKNPEQQFGAPEWLVLIGASVFILVLGVSAFFEADIRWLHFFQAWMYFLTIGLTLQRNRWGYFLGISAAGPWQGQFSSAH